MRGTEFVNHAYPKAVNKIRIPLLITVTSVLRFLNMKESTGKKPIGDLIKTLY